MIAVFLTVAIIITSFGLSFSVFASKNQEDFIYPIDSPDASAVKISTVEDLLAIKNDLYGNYVLMNDIDLSSYGIWDPIGKLVASPFRGKLDGQGHKINGLTVNISIDSASLNNPAHGVGLFGVCDGARIQNLALTNVSVTVSTNSGYVYNNVAIDDRNVFAGAVAGYLSNNSVIHNTYSTGTVTAKASGEALGAFAGGLVGYSDFGLISYSYSGCTTKATTENQMLSAPAGAGGLIGSAINEGIVDCCYNTGNVTASTLDFGDACAGGVIGKSSSADFSVSNSFNEGAIVAKAGNMFSDNAYAGGISGYYNGSIDKTYNSGTISASASSYTGGNANAGGIAGLAVDGATVSNSVIAQSSVTASASGSKYIYRISNGGTKSDNITSSSYASGSTNDASYSYSLNELKSSGPYSLLNWDFGSVWIIVDGKDFPQLKTVEAESEENSDDYIQQHLDFINGSVYPKVLSDQRWAQTYWSEQNTAKANKTEKLYTGFNVAVDLINLRFPDLFADGNIYEVIVADYIANQGVAEDIQHLSEITYPKEIEKLIGLTKDFLSKYWQDGWGELSDEDIFWLFHYKDRPSDEWVNSDFPNNLELIIADTKKSGEWFENIVGVSTEVADALKQEISNYNDFVSWVNSCLDTAAHINSFLSASDEFREILQMVYDNAPEHKDRSSLRRALLNYTNFLGESKETIALEMWARFAVEDQIENFLNEVKKTIEKKTNQWLETALSAKALATLKAIGWVADQAMNIYELITSQGELQEYRELLKANCYFEFAMCDTLKIIESNFVSSQTFENAKLFDAAFKFFKETEIYSMNVYAEFLDTYQNSLIVSIKNGSKSTMASAIEELLINRRALYNTMCHGLVYNLGGKVITVACPTDVDIYNSKNELVVSIVNNEVVMCDGAIDVFVSEKVKFILLPLGEEFRTDIKATANGIMEYCVSVYDENNQNTQTVIYNDIPLTSGQGYTGTVSGELEENPESYNLTSDTEEVIAPSVTVTPEDEFVSIEKVEFSEHKKKIFVSASFDLNYGIYPENATVEKLLWTSSDESIATVTATGEVTGISVGTAYISAYSLCGGVSDYLEVTVIEPGAFEIMSTELPDGYVDTDYKYYLEATDFVSCWSVKEGSLPEGISLSVGGLLSGKPVSSGEFEFTVKAIDDYGKTTEQALTLIIDISKSPEITTDTIPDVKVGEKFSYKLLATGTTEKMVWSIENGKLPNGIQLLQDGTITGVATESGEFTITVKASNGVDPDCFAAFCVVSKRPVTAEGTDGDLAWTLYDNGELLVICNGATENYATSSSPWYSFVSKINTVTFEGEVTHLGERLFEDCTQLKELIIPASVETIGEYALSGCNNLVELSIPFVGSSRTANNTYDSVFGHIFGRSETGINQYHRLEDGNLHYYTYAIPESLRTVSITDASIIPFGAFHNCSNINRIDINDGVAQIRAYSFASCTGLTDFVIPDTVEYIAEDSFNGCSSLSSMTIPFVGSSRTANNTFDSVFGYIFGRCDSSAGIAQYYMSDGSSLSYYYYDVPQSIKTVKVTDADHLPFGAFHNCTNILEFELNDISAIYGYAFANCSSVKEFEIPDSVLTIYEKAFNGCNSLEKISLPFIGSSRDASGTYDAVLGYIFGRANSGTLQYGVVSGTSISGYYYAIPATLTSVTVTDAVQIAVGAFCNCSNLSFLRINDEVTQLSDYSLMGCSGLEELRLPSTFKNLSSDILSDCSNLKKLYMYSRSCTISNSSSCIPSNTTIYAYSNSTANTYADNYNRSFVPIDVVISALSGSNIVVDTANKIIYGVDAGNKNIMSRLVVAGEGVAIASTDGAIVTGITVTLKDVTETITDVYTVIVFGDVNGDGWYDGQDAVLVSCLANGMLTKDDVSEAVYTAADCNHDGVIDEADVALLNQAGTLLANVDQTKPTKVLLETSSEYVEYISIIDQSPENEVENETDIPEIDVEDTNPVENSLFAFIMDLIAMIKKSISLIVSIVCS